MNLLLDGIAWILDLGTGNVRQVTPTLFQPGRVSWSRDGKTLPGVAALSTT